MDSIQPASQPTPVEETNPPGAPSSKIPAVANPPTSELPWRLPIVRLLQPKSSRRRLIAIYHDHMVIALCKRNFSIEENMLTVEGEAALTGELRKARRLDFNDVAGIRIHPGQLFYYFTLLTSRGRSLRFSLPKDQAGHVSQFLRAKLADRVPFHRLWAGRTASILVVLLGIVGGLAALDLASLDQRGLGILVGLLALGVTVAGLWLLFGHGSAWHSASDKVAMHPGRHAVAVAKPPLRSKPLGWTLKLCGLAYWFVLLSPLTDPLRNWLDTQMDAQPQAYIWAILWFPAPLLIFTGYRLCQRRYVPKQTSDPRKPILFLRPFQDDEHTSLQPTGLTAKATGIRSQSAYVRGGKTNLFDLLWSAHPMRVLRMIADYGSGSSEETIARFFERHGPVIAVGKPGEHLASPGAARMYLDDANWQEAVLCEMERARAVVIQPAPSEGVRWELNHVREKVAPTRVLLCLISYWNNPEGYEELSTVVSGTLRVDLPRVVPYLRRPAFVYFDAAWNPHVQELSYKDPVLWPVTSDAADLKYSLDPFVGGMQGGAHQTARPARWIGGPKNWIASLAAMALGTIFLVVPNALVFLSGQAVKMALGGKSVFSTLTRPTPETIAHSPRITLHGRAVPYQVEIPEAMTALKPDNAMIEQWWRTPDKRFDVQVIADKDREDLSALPQARLQANKQEAQAAQLDSSRQFEEGGVNWVQTQITVTTKDGVTVREVVRGASTPAGTVLVVAHIVEAPDSDAVYTKLADECLQSFRFEDGAAK